MPTRNAQRDPRHLHIAVVQPCYAPLIMSGRKRVEARLTVRPRPPWGIARIGERVYFKQRSGPVFAAATIADVIQRELTGASDVAALREAYDARVCGEPEFWASKSGARYATMVVFRGVSAVDYGPAEPPLRGHAARSAWRLLPASKDVWPANAAAVLFRASG